MSEEKRKHITRRSSLFWPIIFIVVGVIFLLNNLGYVQGDLWGNLIKFWPVILIAMGLDSVYRGSGIVGAVFLLTIGCIFLLANLGYLAIDAWQVIIRMWPVLLIAIGLDILIGKRALWLSLIGLLLVLAILAGGIWYYGIQSKGFINVGKEISQSLEGIEQVKIDLEPGIAQVNIKKGTLTDLLFIGTIPENIQIHHNYVIEGNNGVFTLRSRENPIVFSKIRENQWYWNLDLSPQPLIDLKIGLGAGRCAIDLTGLKIKALDISLGIGDAYITLPAEGQFQGKIDGAIGRMIVYLPKGMGLRIKSQTGLGNFKAPEEFMKIGDFYQTEGFDRAVNRVDLNVNQAIGTIFLQTLAP